VKVLTVIEKNHAGLLAEVTSVLEQAKIEILDFTGQVVGDTAVISLQLRPYQAAFRLLSNAGYRVISHDHLLVRLDRNPGALAALSRRLAEAEVDVRGMHIVNKDEAACIVALEATQVDKARAVLSDLLVVERPRRKA
jgi:hypothetical protein